MVLQEQGAGASASGRRQAHWAACLRAAGGGPAGPRRRAVAAAPGRASKLWEKYWCTVVKKLMRPPGPILWSGPLLGGACSDGGTQGRGEAGLIAATHGRVPAARDKRRRPVARGQTAACSSAGGEQRAKAPTCRGRRGKGASPRSEPAACAALFAAARHVGGWLPGSRKGEAGQWARVGASSPLACCSRGELCHQLSGRDRWSKVRVKDTTP